MKDGSGVFEDDGRFNFIRLLHYVDSFYRADVREIKRIAKDFKVTAKAVNINKGLTFEILMKHWLIQSDSPLRVDTNYLVDEEGYPINFAQAGYTDLLADYEGRILNVEVSCKEYVDDKFFKKQLTGALAHLKNSNINLCWLITNKNLNHSSTLKIYRTFMQETNANSERQYDIIPISIEEILIIGRGISERSEKLSKILQAKDMKDVFTNLKKAFREVVETGSIKRNLSSNIWLDTLYSPDKTPTTKNQSPKKPSGGSFLFP